MRCVVVFGVFMVLLRQGGMLRFIWNQLVTVSTLGVWWVWYTPSYTLGEVRWCCTAAAAAATVPLLSCAGAFEIHGMRGLEPSRFVCSG